MKRDEAYMEIIGVGDFEEIKRMAELEDARDDGIAEGLEQGLEQGIAEGLEKGIEQGREQGIEQGTKQAILENARSLYINGVSKDLILKSLNIKENILDKIISEVIQN